MKNKRRIIGILAAMILATIGTVALVGYVQSAKDKAVAQEALVEVYVVDKLVPKGAAAETIKASVSVEQIPARLEQPGAITDLEEVGANVAATDLQPGDQLLAARLVAQGAGVRGGHGQGADLGHVHARAGRGRQPRRRVIWSASTCRSIPSTTNEAGQVFDATTTPRTPRKPPRRKRRRRRIRRLPRTRRKPPRRTPSEETTPNVTRLEFQHVLVTNVQTTNEPVVPDETDQEDPIEQITGAQYVVTLALSPEQSERFVFATEFGHVWLSNEPATVSDDGTRLVTLGNVYSVAK